MAAVFKNLRGTNVLAIVVDVIGAVLLALYALIIGPLGVLRGPIVFERTIWYLWVLVPQGLLARSVRAAIDWRLGNFDSAIAQIEGLAGANEDYFKQKVHARARRRVLEDLYTVLARAYLHAGHIDDAMLVVIRAKKSLGLDRLSGLAELDAKTAHLVRAGLAAGRLLDGGGLATMFVKSSQQQEKPARPTDAAKQLESDETRPKGRQGASRKDDASKRDGGSGSARAGREAKIIPFPPPGPR